MKGALIFVVGMVVVGVPYVLLRQFINGLMGGELSGGWFLAGALIGGWPGFLNGCVFVAAMRERRS